MGSPGQGSSLASQKPPSQMRMHGQNSPPGRPYSLRSRFSFLLSCRLESVTAREPAGMHAVESVTAREPAGMHAVAAVLRFLFLGLGSVQSMPFLRVGVVLAVMLMACFAVRGAEELRPDDEDAKLNAVFREYLKELFRREPLTATRLGEHALDDQLDDLSPAARNATLDFKRRVLKRLPEQIDRDRLSRDGKIDHDIFRSHLAREVWLAENFRPFEDDPRVYGDYITESVYLLLTQSSLPPAVNVKNALARMALIPRVMDVARTTIKNPPRVKVETAIRQAEGAIGFYEQDVFKLAPESESPALREMALP